MAVGTIARSEARCASMLLLLVATAGCSFDTAPIGLVQSGGTQRPAVRGDGEASQAGQAASGSGATSGGAGGSGADDSGTPPATTVPPDPTGSDASAPHPSDPPDDAGVTPSDGSVDDAGADSGTEPVKPSAPTKGLLFDRCVNDHGCSLGLVCYGTGPGHCAQPCAESSDCVDVDGIEFSCSPDEGACRVDCNGETEDVCPKGLNCVDRGSDQRRCMLPREEGTGDRGLFESCDRAHGDDDCVDGLVCHRAVNSRIDGPGYCTEACGGGEGESTCHDVSASSAELECAANVCRFDCSDAACPFGMACEMIGDRGVCHYLTAQP